MTRATLAALSLVLPYLRPQVVRAGTIACLSSKSDWYTEAVGEAPCELTTWNCLIISELTNYHISRQDVGDPLSVRCAHNKP